MSTHFTYEIDERKLRVKLKELEPEVHEEAWQSFESYVSSRSGGSGNTRLKNIQVPVNRNVIVPVVFGILIVFFSIILFNFINIKNPEKSEENASAKTAEPVVNGIVPVSSATVAASAKQTETHKQQEATAQSNENPALSKGAAASQVSKPVNKPAATVSTVQLVNVPLTQPAAKPNATLATKTSPVISTNTALNNPTVAGSEISGSQGTKKKSKRRPVEVVETDSSSDNRPSLGGEDREAEVRPN